MAFCTYCGKKLEDGEVCSCRATAQAPAAEPAKVENPYAAPTPTPAPQPAYAPVEQPVQNQQSAGNAGSATSANQTASGNVFAPIIDLVKGIVKNPFKASEEFYEKASIVTSGIMVGALALVYMLSVVLPMLRAMIAYNINLASTGLTAGEIFKKLVDSYAYNPFSVISGVLYPILYVALMGGVVIGTAFLVNAVILKGKVELRKVFALCGATILPIAACSVLRILIRAIYLIPAPVNGLSVPFHIISAACGLLTLLLGLNILNKEIADRKKLVLTLMITVATLTLGSWLICMFMNKSYWFVTLPF